MITQQFFTLFFFFNDTATTEIYTLSLHDALPIYNNEEIIISKIPFRPNHIKKGGEIKKVHNLLSISNYNIKTNEDATDRKSTRLNSSHVRISYAVFCLKKKKKKKKKKKHKKKKKIKKRKNKT